MNYPRRLLSILLLATLAACSGATSDLDPDFTPPGGGDPSDQPVFASSINLSASRPQLFSDESTFESGVEITATALDAGRAALANATVSFSVLVGGGALSVGSGQKTAADGTLKTVLHAGTGGARTIKVRASSGTESATIDVPVIARDTSPVVDRILFTSSRMSLFTDEDSFDAGVLLQATALDAGGAAIANVPVGFSVVSGGGALSRGAGGSTDESGIATSVLHSAGGSPRQIIVQVAAGGVQQQLSVNVVERTAFNPVDRIVISASKGSLLVSDDTFEKGVTLTAHFLDGNGVTVSDVPSSFAIIAGGGALTVSQSQGADGSREAVLHSAGGKPRDIVVGVASGDVTALVVIPVQSGGVTPVADVDRIILSAATTVLMPSQSTESSGLTLTATAVSPGSVPIPLAPLSFEIVSGTGLLFPEGQLTASNGSLDAILTTGGDPTPRTIVVRANSGGKSAMISITVQPLNVSLRLLTSTPALPSAVQDIDRAVLIAAVAVDSSNRRTPGIPISFETSSGALVILSDVTDANGEAVAQLTTNGDPTLRTIVITAEVPGNAQSTGATLSVPVIGTTISLELPQSTSIGSTEDVRAVLRDSDGNPIVGRQVTLTSSLGNVINPEQRLTDANGVAVFTYSAGTGGTDSVVANGVGAVAAASLLIPPFEMKFLEPIPSSEIPVDQSVPVRLSLRQNGSPLVGQTIAVSSTRGQLGTQAVVTDDAGIAETTIVSSGAGGAGGASIDALYQNLIANTTVEFVSLTPSQLTLVVQSRSVSTGSSTELVATVRDVVGSPVKRARVQFTLVDPTLGILSSGSEVTDSSGRAVITYTAGSTSSAPDAVVITAAVEGLPSKSVRLTVGGQALRISLGTGNVISADETDTVYELPYSVLVTDSSGNPVPNVQVSFAAKSLTYQKGQYLIFLQADDTEVWQPVYAIQPTDGAPGQNQFGCLNEDANLDGVLAIGEDFNGNGKLDPGNVATVPSSLSTDALGQITFPVRYIKQFASWSRIRLTAAAQVGGSESSESIDFTLPISADDALSTNVAPAGRVSPFGTTSDCANPG